MMIAAVLERKDLSARGRITVKTLISAGIVALAVILPQIAHLTLGAQAGMRFLPMYLPVLLGGCLLGAKWGLTVGALSPLVSFLLTSAAGSPMPAPARLPFMMAELALFAMICGLFSGRLLQKPLLAFPAVWAAEISGRAFFLALVAAVQAVMGADAPFTAAMIFAQIRMGLPGLALQAVIVPALAIGLSALLRRDGR